jgi:hypothetical protein
MLRAITLLLLCVATTVHAATATVTLNGAPVAVPVVEAGGKAYIDVVALMTLLGGKATFDAATHKVAISSTAPSPAPPVVPKTGGSTGTAQLAGDNGELGKVYSLIKSRPLYFSLTGAAFTTEQVVVGDALVVPKADEKLLVLHFTIQNPHTTELTVRWDSLKITAVDSMNVSHEGVEDWADAENHQKLGITLKPAQKVAIYTAIVVPAKGSVPKLMVQPPTENNGPILRYDLRGKVAGLKAPIADPADASGATALPIVPGALNAAYPLANYDLTVEKFELVATKLGELEPEEGERFFVATVLVKNASPATVYTRWDSLNAVLTSTDGDELTYKDMFLATAPRSFGQDVKAGQDARVRLIFSVPKGSTPAKLALQEGESRTYEFTAK